MSRWPGLFYIAILAGVAAYANRLVLVLFIWVLNHCQDTAGKINESSSFRKHRTPAPGFYTDAVADVTPASHRNPGFGKLFVNLGVHKCRFGYFRHKLLQNTVG